MLLARAAIAPAFSRIAESRIKRHAHDFVFLLEPTQQTLLGHPDVGKFSAASTIERARPASRNPMVLPS